MGQKNILTFDIENWLESSLEIFPKGFSVSMEQEEYFDSFVEKNTNVILSVLEKHKATATFFILGSTAQRHPDLVRKIHSLGHEIASHGYTHTCVFRQNKEEFAEDIRKSIELLGSIIKERVVGYRAPYFSINEKSLWALEIIRTQGVLYDSSIFPLQGRNSYGIFKAKRFPHCIKEGFWEVPLSTNRVFGMNVPMAGGGYYRFLPYPFIRSGIKKINNEGKPAVIYFHPYELNDGELKKSFANESTRFKFIKYSQNVGRGKMKCKLERLLKDFNFTNAKNFLLSND